MHDSVMKYVGDKVFQYALNVGMVLDVGSMSYTGGCRKYFSGNYVGIDRRGDAKCGVDLEMDAHHLTFNDQIFDVVLCTEMIEHDEKFWLTMTEIGRVLKPGGYLILTGRGNGYEKHEQPSDFYRFMPDSFKALFELAGCRPLEIMEDPQFSGVFGIGVKQ